MLIIEKRQIPLISPTEDEASVLEFERKPDVPSVNGILRSPAVTHIYVGIFFSGNGYNPSALGEVGSLGILVHTRISGFLPRTPDGFGNSGVGGIRPPTGTFRPHYVVETVFFEDCRSFESGSDESSDVFPGEIEIVIGQQADLDDTVGLG